MSYPDLIRNLGFDSDPFAKTNADEEERLENYFIAPPFYAAVYGDIASPKSSLVFAPRGNGKTALKRKIELSSQSSNFLCIAYNSFRTTGKTINEINMDFHLTSIIRLLLVALVSSTYEKGIIKLNNSDRHILYIFIKRYLNAIDQSELKECISSIKNLSDRARELWNALTGPIALVINALAAKIGLNPSEIKKFEEAGGSLGDLMDQLRVLEGFSKKLGFSSVYILFDRIDENNLTSNSSANAYRFVEPLITDLHFLELPGYGFKFFLWDLLLDNYRKVARPDRVKYYQISWDVNQLVTMLSERLRAYSSGRVSNLKTLIEQSSQFELDLFISYFAQGSPRNLIRICKEILDQQSQIDSTATKISSEAIIRGFDKIAENISVERYPDMVIKELRKTKRCNFTIKYVYSNIFKFTQQAALNKIRNWEETGAVQQIGTIQATKGARTSNHYGIADLFLAKYIFYDLSIFEFSKEKLSVCQCGHLLVRDFNLNKNQTCEKCQQDVENDAS